MLKLTLNEQQVYASIQEYIGNNNQSPTMEEIKEDIECNSLTTVQRAIEGLEDKGWIIKDKNISRGIKLKIVIDTVSIPLIGTVACGIPLLAEENIESYIQTDKHFIKGDAKKYFYLKAKGNSMDKRDILDGDLLLIHSQQSAQEGQVVLALINDSATIKVFRRGKGFVMLEPQSSDSSHKPIILREDFKIQGVFEKVLRI